MANRRGKSSLGKDSADAVAAGGRAGARVDWAMDSVEMTHGSRPKDYIKNSP